jgi:glycosyltransferase involved in cell wall biosynthesis
MKLLDITHFYSEKGGGIKTYIQNKIEYLKDKEDVQHTLIIPGEEDGELFLKRTKIIKIKSPYFPFNNHYRLLINPVKLSNILKQEKPDVVEIGSPFLIPTVVNSKKESLKYKTVGFFHSNLESVVENINKIKGKIIVKKIARSYTYKTYSNLDLVIAPSYYVKNYILDIGVQNVEVIYHGIDVDFFNKIQPEKNLRQKFNIPDDKIVFIYVGRFSEDKNFDELIKIIKLLLQIQPNRFFFLLIGAGPLKEYALSSLNSNTLILDYISDREYLVKMLKMSDIFITASKTDTFGLSLIEAQACGLPVLAYNKTSFPEIVFYKEYLATDVLDFISKALKLSNSLNNLDRNLMKNFIRNEFDLNKNFDKLFRIYREL